MGARYLALWLGLFNGSCVGTTGGDSFEFEAFASGPPSAEGQSYTFTNALGHDVRLTRARLHVAGVYLNQAVPTQVSANPSCMLAGIYVAEVNAPLVVDLLSAQPQPFGQLGTALTERAVTGEVWLNGGDVNELHDPTVVLEVAGVAAKSGTLRVFRGSLSIAANRAGMPRPSAPGAAPICKQRIVSPIPVDLRLSRGGRLLLEIDPAKMFAGVDFALLPEGPDGVFTFEDANTPGPSLSLYNGLHRSAGVYALRWEP